ncbi:MAG: Ig family protein, partial [Candidatus Solibacter sp.]|nr:Ig family protein [Candidatus Solibacter sp.]
MRYLCFAFTVAAFSGLFPSVLDAQGAPTLSITNYQFVSEQRLSQFVSNVTYRADLVNAGPAKDAITASVSSRASNIQVIAGQGNLHFAPVPANRTVTSLDTFTIMVDRTIAFDLADLQWTFLAPVANPGPNRTAKVGDTVFLDGSGSTNPSGYGTLSYNWKLTSTPPGSATVLFWYDTVKPQFAVDVPGNYVLTLTVSNGGGSDSAVVTVSTTNTPPVANAGPNRTVSPGANVTLNGSGSSDVDGDPLTYSWTLTVRPPTSNAVLLAPNSVAPQFTVDKAGSYTIRLIVNDGKADSAPAFVTISTGNTAPVANAGPNQIQAVGALVQLDGSGSTDVDGNPLTYLWSLIAVPPGSLAALSSTTAVKPTFTADRAGTYVAQLIVNDGIVSSAAATVQVTTNPPLAPTASAGPNQTVPHRTTVRLNGSGTDPQDLPLTFQWSLTAKPPGSTAALSSLTTANPTFVADLPGNYVAQLIVNNGLLPSAPSMVTITTTNTAPVADAGLPQFVPVASNVSLTGAGSSDADGDPLTYTWSLTARPPGSNATLSSTTAVSPTFFADLAGTYVVQLIVSDGFSSSSPATVTVTAGGKTITLTPNPLNMSTNTPGSLTVTLGSPAGPGGQLVALDSSNPTVAAIQSNVMVPQGLGGVNVPVTSGSGTGSATITAIATGYTPGTATVNVAPPTVTMTLSAGIVGVTRTLNGTITLSSPAPNGGVTVTLSDLSGLVTFQPASIPFATGST